MSTKAIVTFDLTEDDNNPKETITFHESIRASTKAIVTFDLTDNENNPKEIITIHGSNQPKEIIAIDCDEDDNSIGEACPICLEHMHINDSFVTKCGHAFHFCCLFEMWDLDTEDYENVRPTQFEGRCPVCRFQFPHFWDFVNAMTTFTAEAFRRPKRPCNVVNGVAVFLDLN